MKKFINIMACVCLLSLAGCTGLFESRTCGVRNSQWERMSAAEQFDVERAFHEKQRLADQIKLIKIHAKQQEKIAKERINNEKAQARRLKDESNALKKQQLQIEKDLERKKQDYLHPELITENMTGP